MTILAPHLKRGTATPTMHVAYAGLLRRMGKQSRALRHLAPLAKADDLTDDERMAVMFALGDLLDDMGEYERAFVAYSKANRLRRGRYSRETREREVGRLIETFSGDKLDSMPRSGRSTEVPVFIVGMPRSGTSLVEQVLATDARILLTTNIGCSLQLAVGINYLGTSLPLRFSLLGHGSLHLLR